MNSSEHLGELATALSFAQSEIKGAVKDSKNPFFKSNYADLESVWDAIRESLTKNGLSVIQIGVNVDSVPHLATRLLHKSGQWIEGYMPLNPTKSDPQGLGSAITYMRRYGLAAMVGVIQTDDDGNAASIQQKIVDPLRVDQPPSFNDFVPKAGEYKGIRLSGLPSSALLTYKQKLEENFGESKPMPPMVNEIYQAITAIVKSRDVVKQSPGLQPQPRGTASQDGLKPVSGG